jgi:HlyD family secretion protein
MLHMMKQTKGWKLPALAAAGVLFALVSVFSRKDAPARQPQVAPPQAEFAKSVAGIGLVEPKSETLAIGVELPGVIRAVHVKVGDRVRAGDPLFSLDQRDIDAQIKTLQAALDSAKVQAEDARAQFAIVTSIDDKRAVARDDFNRRKFAVALSAARIEEIKAQIEQAQTTKQRLTVKAPIDGQVLEVEVRPGEYAPAGALAAPLMRMGDMSRLHVRVEIDEMNAQHIKPDSPARGFTRGDTRRAIPLTFVRFEPYVRPKQNLAVTGQRVDTHVLEAIYALPPEEKSIFVGQQMDVFIDDSAIEENSGENHAS